MRVQGVGVGVERHRLLVVVDPAAVGGGGDAPLVLATQVARRTGSASGLAGGTGRSGSGTGDRLSFQALVAEPRQLPLVIVDNDVESPGRGWELRSPGLWADHVCEQPDEHWSYGLEAFALAIDDPAELLGRGYGQRTPLGWELEFEASARPRPTGPRSVCQAGIVHGLLLGPGRQIEIEGQALRGHAWDQPDDEHQAGALLGQSLGGDGGDDVVSEVALPTVDGVWWVARTASGVRTRGA